jgi:hypothetical protein
VHKQTNAKGVITSYTSVPLICVMCSLIALIVSVNTQGVISTRGTV